MVLFTSCSAEQDSSDIPDTQLGAGPFNFSISTWKNGQTSAYSIIFDDFCADGTHGIQDYADTIAYNRQIPIGFGIITGSCDDQEWQRAREMITHGHEAVNHTHSHRCGKYFDWCQDVWDHNDFPLEIDGSTNMIESQLSVRPTFFIFPYDLATDTMLSHLNSIEYYGSRTGAKMETNDAWFTDPFDLKFDVNFPADDKEDNQRWTLNELLDQTVQTGGFGFREVHGVDDQSWGVVSASELRVHFDYAVSLRNQGKLWVGNPSDIVAYRFAREHCKPVITEGEDYYEVSFEVNAICAEYPTELTFVFDKEDNAAFWQNNIVLAQNPHPTDPTKMMINVQTQGAPLRFGYTESQVTAQLLNP